MKQIKAFLNGAINAVGKALLVLSFLILLGVMTIWTIGLVYVADKGGCHLEDNKVVCELKKE